MQISHRLNAILWMVAICRKAGLSHLYQKNCINFRFHTIERQYLNQRLKAWQEELLLNFSMLTSICLSSCSQSIVRIRRALRYSPLYTYWTAIYLKHNLFFSRYNLFDLFFLNEGFQTNYIFPIMFDKNCLVTYRPIPFENALTVLTIMASIFQVCKSDLARVN